MLRILKSILLPECTGSGKLGCLLPRQAASEAEGLPTVAPGSMG